MAKIPQVIRTQISKDRQCNGQDTRGNQNPHILRTDNAMAKIPEVIRTHISKDRQCNGQDTRGNQNPHI